MQLALRPLQFSLWVTDYIHDERPESALPSQVFVWVLEKQPTIVNKKALEFIALH